MEGGVWLRVVVVIGGGVRRRFCGLPLLLLRPLPLTKHLGEKQITVEPPIKGTSL